MAKRPSTLDLPLPARRAGVPAYIWLCDVLRGGILSGRLARGTRLPPTRDLARQYQLSRGTVVLAFEQLKAEGYVDARTGSGTYVNCTLPEQLLHARPSRNARAAPAPPERTLSKAAPRALSLSVDDAPSTRAFRANQPALDLFPTAQWAQIAGRRMRRASMKDLLACCALGYRPLQEVVADYLTTSRGVHCVPEQIAIVAGVQEALYLSARVFIDAGDRVCMENPGYRGAAQVFASFGAKLTPVAIDAEGMCVPSARLRNVRLAYTTPAHQFPLGMSMSLQRRMQLLAWARQQGAVIFEDDYDSEFRYSGRPLPALQGLDQHGLVLFAGSFSKTLFPALRLGYLVIPPDLIDRFSAVKSITSRHAPLLEQAVLCEFMEGGHFTRHIRRMREVYAERFHTLLTVAEERLGGRLTVSKVEAGLQTVGFLPDGMSAPAVAQAAAARAVEVIPLSDYYHAGVGRAGLQLGFAAVAPREIRRGVDEL
ncbi:MAG TPA: PLP-dependent aminotransferase family protein, partial [Longimicrobiales bacterium]